MEKLHLIKMTVKLHPQFQAQQSTLKPQLKKLLMHKNKLKGKLIKVKVWDPKIAQLLGLNWKTLVNKVVPIKKVSN